MKNRKRFYACYTNIEELPSILDAIGFKLAKIRSKIYDNVNSLRIFNKERHKLFPNSFPFFFLV